MHAGATVTTTTTASVYGPGDGVIFLANVHCTGSEATVLHCPHSKITLGTYCTHNRDVGVQCEGELTAPLVKSLYLHLQLFAQFAYEISNR